MAVMTANQRTACWVKRPRSQYTMPARSAPMTLAMMVSARPMVMRP